MCTICISYAVWKRGNNIFQLLDSDPTKKKIIIIQFQLNSKLQQFFFLHGNTHQWWNAGCLSGAELHKNDKRIYVSLRQCLQSTLQNETQDDPTETLEIRWNKVHLNVKKHTSSVNVSLCRLIYLSDCVVGLKLLGQTVVVYYYYTSSLSLLCTNNF